MEFLGRVQGQNTQVDASGHSHRKCDLVQSRQKLNGFCCLTSSVMTAIFASVF